MLDVRTYCSEPNRGRQRWKEQEREQQAVYANRRRIRGRRGSNSCCGRGARSWNAGTNISTIAEE